MVDIVTRLGKGSPLTNAEVDANFTNLAEVSGVTGEPMGHEDRTTSTISFNASTRTFTIAPVASSFTVWCKGKKVVVSSAQTVTIPNTTGMYSIYYDANGVLSAKSGYFTFSLEAPTAYVYWNAATGTAPYFGDERHGVVLDWQTHEYLHRTRGAALASGFAASGYVLGGNGSSNSHAQITLEGGTFFDEDMKIIVTATNTPTAGTWEQDLLSPARIPVLYLSGTAWVIDTPTDYPLKQGTARPQYNAYSGGVWSTADVANNKYATSWILATNNLTYPVIAIIGQAQNDSQSAAEAVDFTELQLPGFPSVEFRPLYKLIFQCADSCTNAVHASLVSITDIRSIAAAGTAASIVTDHGNLSGLSDDDHPQYIHVDTLRTVSAAVKASFLPSQTSNAGKFLQTDGAATSWQALTSGNVTTALGFTPYNATNPSGYISGITSGMVTTALGFTPYNATNPSGYVTAAGARGAISVTGAGSYDSATGVINIVGGVTSFNTRTGAITLSSADVTTALGFTPYNNTNPSGYITGITSTMVTTALGFTPYNSSNPNGYISSITSANVTTALGFTPYNATNPSGYITSSALSGYLTSASAASTYLALTGDATRSGTTTLSGVTVFNNYISLNGDFYHNGSQYILNAAQNGWINIVSRNGGNPFINNVTYNGSTILHAGNYNSYALPLSGGAMTGSILLHSTSGTNGFYNGTGDGANFSTYNFLLRGWNGMAFENPTSGGAYPNQVSGVVDFRNGIINMKGGFQTNGSTVLHAGNYSSYALPLSGGNMTGRIYNAAAASGLTYNAPFFVRDNEATGSNNSFSGIAFASSPGADYVIGKYSNGGTGLLQIRNHLGTGIWVMSQDGTTTHSGEQYIPILTVGGLGRSASNTIGANLGSGAISWNNAQLEIKNSDAGSVGIAFHRAGYTSNAIYANDANGLRLDGNIIVHAGNYNSYAPTLTGGGASGTWGINVTGSSGSSTTSTYVTSQDIRALSPSSTAAFRQGFGFTSWANNNSAPYADYLALRSYTDASGGNDNLVMFNKSTIAMRVWQQGWGSASAYASYADVLMSNNYSSYALPLSGGTVTGATTFNHITTNFGNSGVNTGIAIYSGSGAGDYGRIRFFEGGVNNQTIHIFPPAWQGASFTGGSAGAINLTGQNGVTIGNWNVPGAAINNAGEMWLRSNLYLGYSGTYTIGTNVWAGGGGYPGYAYGGGNHRFGFSSASGVIDVYADGNFYATDSSHLVLHAANYNGYAPTLTGGNASGTWGINITGNASTVGSRSVGTGTDNIAFLNGSRNIVTQNPESYSGEVRLGAAWGRGGVYTSSTLSLSTSASEIHFVFGDVVRASINSSGTASFGTVSSTGLNRRGTSGNLNTDFGNTPAGTQQYQGDDANVSNSPGGTWWFYDHYRHSNSSNLWGTQIAWGWEDNSNRLAQRNVSGGGFSGWVYYLNSGNYNSYAPTLTGGGASGTWGINISGNAASASSLASDTSSRFRVITFTGEGYDSGNGSQPTSYGIYQQGGGWSHPYPDLCIGFHTGIKIGAYFGYNGTRFYNNSDWATEIFSVGNGDNNVRVTNTLFVGGNTALHAGNYSSYAGGLSTGNNWTNYNYFVANRNTTSDSPPLQAFSNNGSGAIMSFHRGGYYAVNFGLDSDNVMRIGGWSAGANRWQLDMSGNMTVAGNVTAYSDERLKKDWAPVSAGFVEALAKIKAGTYTRIDSEERQAGVSAQDFQNLLPETVSEDNEGTLSLAYGNAALVSAVELAKDNVELRARIERLESLINKLIGD